MDSDSPEEEAQHALMSLERSGFHDGSRYLFCYALPSVAVAAFVFYLACIWGQLWLALLSIIIGVAGVFVSVASAKDAEKERKAVLGNLKARREVRHKAVSTYNAQLNDDYDDARLRMAKSIPPIFPLAETERMIFTDRATVVWDGGFEDVPNLFRPEKTSTTSGGVKGALIGGILLGPAGALAGYAASKKTTVTTMAAATEKRAVVQAAAGTLTITSERVVFVSEAGKVVETPRHAIRQVTWTQAYYAAYTHGSSVGALSIRFIRAGALPDERFIVRNPTYLAMALNSDGYALPMPARPSGRPS